MNFIEQVNAWGAAHFTPEQIVVMNVSAIVFVIVTMVLSKITEIRN